MVFAVHLLLACRLYRWHVPGFSFAFEAGAIAKSLAQTGVYGSPWGIATGPTAVLSPVYPALLSCVFRLFGVYTPASAVVALMLNAAFVAGTVVLVGLIAWRLFNDKLAALVSAGLAGFLPTVFLMSEYLWETQLAALLLAAFLLANVSMQRSCSVRTSCAIGCLGGLLFLTNISCATFMPAAIGIAFRGNWRRQWRYAVLVFAIILTIAIPWTIRNKITVEQFGRCCIGFELRIGNNETVWSTGSTYFDLSTHPTINRREAEMYKRLGENRWNSNNMVTAIAYIRNNPLHFLILSERRIRDFWFGTFMWTSGLAEGHGVAVLLSTSLYVLSLSVIPVITLIGFGGILQALHRQTPAAALLSFLLIYPLPMYFTSVQLHHQYLAELVMIVFGGLRISVAIKTLMQRSGNKRRRPADVSSSVEVVPTDKPSHKAIFR